MRDVEVTSSDRRLKQDIHTIPDALERVRRLRGVNYHRIGSPPEERQYGVIAQDVREVLPDAVLSLNAPSAGGIAGKGAASQRPEETLYVDYNSLVAVLIEAVKTQEARIQKLERQIEQLEPLGP